MGLIKKIGFALIIIALLTYIFIIVSPRIFEGFYPFGIKTAVVTTGSMMPAIEVDDFVLLEKPNVIEEGDIVAYKTDSNQNEIFHRVIRVDGDSITTKGDANNVEDKVIDKSQITGVYIGKIHFLGKIITFITKPVVFSIIIVLLIVWMLIPSKKEKTRKKEVEKNEET